MNNKLVWATSAIIIVLVLIFDVQIKFDESGNKLSFLSLSAERLDFFLEYQFYSGELASKALRVKKKIKIFTYDSTGIIQTRTEGNIEQQPIIRTYYDKKGRIVKTAELKDKYFHGETKVFNNLGDLEETSNYIEGQIVGVKKGDSEIFYPYIYVFYDEGKAMFQFKFNVDHIKREEYSNMKINYDFTETNGPYYTPRYNVVLDTSEFAIELDSKFENKALEIYYNLEVDGVEHPTIAKKLIDMIE